MEPIVRISISNDCEWETQFIPWLEEKEENNVGVEDGVFVATVDPALRYLQPGEEDNFLTYCIDKKLTHVSTLRLRHYIQEGIYEFQSEDYDVDSFKTNLSNLDSFKTDNCCTPFLEQDDGYLSNLFNHLHSDLNKVIRFVESRDKYGTSRSKVLVEESACEMEQLYNKHRQNTDGFSWGKKQKKDLEFCPDMECFVDSPETSKKRRSSQIDENIGELICYGYGFEKSGDSLQITPKLNMSRIFNLLWLLPRQYPGLHSSYLYFGDSHAFFPVHLEDALTLSLNFLHIGKPKVWVFIPPWATELLEFHLHRSTLHLSHTACSNVLGHKTVFPTTDWLKARNIPFKVLVQRPGDLVVIYPYTAHFGFNAGPNIAQAINIGTKSWIPYGINAKKCTCLDRQIHIDIAPLVAAFRKDLLGPMKRGEIIPTPAIIKGMQLLTDRMLSSPNLYKDMLDVEQSVKVKCPARCCNFTTSKFPVDEAKKVLVRHAKATHRPIFESSYLLHKIEDSLKE